MRADGLSLSRVARFSEMIIHLQQEECFTGQSGHGSLKLITSVISHRRRSVPELWSICRKRLD